MATVTRTNPGSNADKVVFTWLNHAEHYYKHFELWANLNEDDKKRFGGLLEKARQDRSLESSMEFWKEINVAWLGRTKTIPEQEKDTLAQGVRGATTEDEASVASRRMLFMHADHYKYQFAGLLEDKYKSTMKPKILEFEGELDTGRLQEVEDEVLRNMAIHYPQFLIVEEDKETGTRALKINLLQACLKVEEDLKNAINDEESTKKVAELQNKLDTWRKGINKTLKNAMKNVPRDKAELIVSGVRYTPIRFIEAYSEAEYMHTTESYLDAKRSWTWDFLYLISMSAYTGRLLKDDEKKDESGVVPPPFPITEPERTAEVKQKMQEPPVKKEEHQGGSPKEEDEKSAKRGIAPPPFPITEPERTGAWQKRQWSPVKIEEHQDTYEEFDMPPMPLPEIESRDQQTRPTLRERAVAKIRSTVGKVIEERKGGGQEELDLLYNAVKEGNIEYVRMHIRKKAVNLPYAARNPLVVESLINEAKSADFPITRLLIESGADVNSRVMLKEGDHSNFYSYTLLALAVYHGNTELVRFLLERGADRNLPFTVWDMETTVLMHMEIVMRELETILETRNRNEKEREEMQEFLKRLNEIKVLLEAQ